MALLTVAVCLLTLLTLVHLLVTFAVVRRLREHANLLNARPTPGPGGGIAAAGTAVGAFTAVTTTGEPIGDADLARPTLVGFFTPGCAPCRTAIPKFLDAARDHGGGRTGVLAVVAGLPEETAEYAETLAAVARVVVELPDDPVTAAFDINSYPAFAVVADGTVQVSGMSLNDLAVAA